MTPVIVMLYEPGLGTDADGGQGLTSLWLAQINALDFGVESEICYNRIKLNVSEHIDFTALQIAWSAKAAIPLPERDAIPG